MHKKTICTDKNQMEIGEAVDNAVRLVNGVIESDNKRYKNF